MAKYFVNSQPQPNRDHEVHVQGCAHMPAPQHAIPLGEHVVCQTAVAKAKIRYPTANGCFYCCRPCHTS
ncbi:hypothetical protein FDZ71_00335 [bacterium]|nr:MAG: hypothetical protein FDZ71_00335 [bacterium]